MRIHFNISPVAAAEAIHRATRNSDTWREVFERHGSHSHRVAYEVKLSGDSPYRTNSGTHGAGYNQAASWDQWGIFLNTIFQADPNARVGGAKNPVYDDADDFHRKTEHRFDTELYGSGAVGGVDHPNFRATAHRWRYEFESANGPNFRCDLNTKRHPECGATQMPR